MRRTSKLTAAAPLAFKRTYDVWEFRSVDGKQVVTGVRVSYPDSTRYQHEYQKLLGQVDAFNAAEAERLVLSGQGAQA